MSERTDLKVGDRLAFASRFGSELHGTVRVIKVSRAHRERAGRTYLVELEGGQWHGHRLYVTDSELTPLIGSPEPGEGK